MKILILNFFVLLLPVFLTGSEDRDCEKAPHRNGVYFENDYTISTKNVSQLRTFSKAAITSDAPGCAEIAKNILQRGGTICDATIAGLVCQGAVHPQSSGIGGGFIAVHYDAKTKKSMVLNAREKAGASATEAMFDDNSNASNEGGLAVAVPGEVKGYLELHKKCGGKVKWADLFQPSIDILERGFKVDAHMAKALNSNREIIKREESLREVFINPQTNDIYREGESVRFPVLAKTLSFIAKNGGEQFYNAQSSLSKMIVQDLKSFGSIITQNDFSQYTAKWTPSLTVPGIYGGYTMHTAGAPASGASIALVMRILSNYGSRLKADDVDSLHLMTEAFKHAYGRRGKLGDPDDRKFGPSIRDHEKKLTSSADYLNSILKKISIARTSDRMSDYQDGSSNNRGHGTAHFSIIDQDGNALTVTTTVNTYPHKLANTFLTVVVAENTNLGARIRSRQTGIIFNDQMDDFATDRNQRRAAPANAVGGGKRPLSSACPVIFVDKNGKVRLAAGSAGGIQIISAVSFASANYLWYGKPLDEAIQAHRLHHTFDPNVLEIEQGMSMNLIRGLQNKGHRLKYPWRITVVTSVAKDDQGLSAFFDPRKPGSADGF